MTGVQTCALPICFPVTIRSIHQEETEEKYATKRWKINQNNIRDTFIDEYANSGYKPVYMVTRSYYYEQNDIKKVKEDNKRMNNVIEDFLNPRSINDYYICKDHFIEQHKDKLVKKSRKPVLNTIMKEWELDWDGSSVEIKKGGFHVHSLFSEIDDNVVLNPNGKIRKSIERIYGMDTIPISLLESDEGLTRVKTDLLEYAIRKRCDFIGDSQMSLDIQVAQEYGSFSGDTPVAIAYQHVSAPLTPVTEIEPSLDPALNNFFSVALAKDPSDRYQSANAMLKDLKKLSKGEGITTQIPRQKKPINRRNRIAALALALVLLVGGGSYVVFSPTSTTMQTLPNVVGLTETEARAQLEGFTITIQRAPDPRIPRDRVSNQLPLATTRVSQGSAVTLTLSDGPGDTTVPIGLIGKPLEEVRTALVAAGLRVSRTVAVDSEQEPGIVLKVIPEPGTIIEAGSGVVLEIASGNVQVPSLVGVTEIEAKTLLTQAGFFVKVVEVYDANQPLGIVLAQAPSAGEIKIIGSPVTITINKAPN